MKLNRRMLLCKGAAFAPTVLASCASAPTHYYRLAVIPGPASQSPTMRIGVRSVSIPDYLNQDGIAKPSAGYEFAAFGSDAWAEPLAGMLQDVTVQELAQRLPIATVVNSGGAIVAVSDVLIETNVLRFDPDNSGRIILTMQVALKSDHNFRPWTVQTFTSSAPPAGQDAADIVATMSTLWAGAINQLASSIIEQWNQHAIDAEGNA